MTTERVRCAGTNAAGEPCKSTIIQKDGFCSAHGPDGLNAMRERGKKGARALRTPGLKEGELGPLDNPDDAARWLRISGEAVATGRLTHQSCAALVRTVEGFLKAHDAGKVTRQLAALTDAAKDYERSGDVEAFMKRIGAIMAPKSHIAVVK